MKIAIVHELLTMRGGAERVLKIITEMFPDAPIYTLLYDEKKLGSWFPKERVRTSSLQQSWTTRFLLATHQSINHHLYLRRFPSAVEAWDFSEFDVVLSFSSAFAHGIITNSTPKHLCYVHSPARYLWDRTHDVVREASAGIFGPLKRWYLGRIFHSLRIWDTETADRPDTLLAASKTVQRRIQLYWRKQSNIVYPPIDDFWLKEGKTNPSSEKYYFIVSSLVRYKRIELAILSCNALQKHLKIVGEGPERKRLEALAGPTIEFCGWKENEELKDLYTSARATLFPGDEDFGLVPVESMACGTPVIAFRSGGALETIIENSTGEFFDEPTSESLTSAMKKFEQKKYSKDAMKSQAQKFSRQIFEEKIKAALEQI